MAESTVQVPLSRFDEVCDLRAPFEDKRCHCGHAASSHNSLGYCQVYGDRAPSSGDCTCGSYEDARNVAWRAGRDAALNALLSQPPRTVEVVSECSLRTDTWEAQRWVGDREVEAWRHEPGSGWTRARG